MIGASRCTSCILWASRIDLYLALRLRGRWEPCTLSTNKPLNLFILYITGKHTNSIYHHHPHRGGSPSSFRYVKSSNLCRVPCAGLHLLSVGVSLGRSFLNNGSIFLKSLRPVVCGLKGAGSCFVFKRSQSIPEKKGCRFTSAASSGPEPSR